MQERTGAGNNHPAMQYSGSTVEPTPAQRSALERAVAEAHGKDLVIEDLWVENMTETDFGEHCRTCTGSIFHPQVNTSDSIDCRVSVSTPQGATKRSYTEMCLSSTYSECTEALAKTLLRYHGPYETTFVDADGEEAEFDEGGWKYCGRMIREGAISPPLKLVVTYQEQEQ